MQATAPTRDPAHAELTDEAFERLRGLIGELTGIHLAESKQELVAARLRRRLVALGLPDFGAYHDFVAAGGGGARERTALVNAITTNKTDFFREPHHFAFLRRLAGEWRRDGHRPVRIWSAACSTGEEPYSIAITLHDVLPPPWDVRILATDIDTDVLAHASAALYRRDRLGGLGGVSRFFGAEGEQLRLRPDVRARVELAQLNLNAAWQLGDRFDAIFCRNVVIYFDRDTQRRLFARLAEQLVPGGHLFLGHSETLSGMDALFEAVGPTVYRRRLAEAPRGRSARIPRARTARILSMAAASVEAAPPAVAVPAPAPRPRLEPPPTRPRAADVAVAPAVAISRTTTRRGVGQPQEHGIAFRRIVVGEAVACKEPTRLATLLGSCVAACLYDPIAAIGGMNHFLLPSTDTDGGGSARYGVHAMDLLINELMRLGAERRRLQGKLFGAGHVLDIVSSEVPRKNAEFARWFFATEGIPLITSRLGGDRPLEIHFMTDTGRALVRPLASTAPDVRREEERAAAAATSQPSSAAGSVELWI